MREAKHRRRTDGYCCCKCLPLMPNNLRAFRNRKLSFVFFRIFFVVVCLCCSSSFFYFGRHFHFFGVSLGILITNVHVGMSCPRMGSVRFCVYANTFWQNIISDPFLCGFLILKIIFVTSSNAHTAPCEPFSPMNIHFTLFFIFMICFRHFLRLHSWHWWCRCRCCCVSWLFLFNDQVAKSISKATT